MPFVQLTDFGTGAWQSISVNSSNDMYISFWDPHQIVKYTNCDPFDSSIFFPDNPYEHTGIDAQNDGSVLFAGWGSTAFYQKPVVGDPILLLATSGHCSFIKRHYNGSVYACEYGGMIYYSPDGSLGSFYSIYTAGGMTLGIAINPINGDIYYCCDDNYIYKQTGGVGSFDPVGFSARWQGITADIYGNIWAVVWGGHIYKQTEGIGDFVQIDNASRLWRSITSAPDGKVYAIDYLGGVYVFVAPEYRMYYDGNGNTGGTAPVDPTVYTDTDTITVLGPGDITKENETFSHWNTQSDGGGTSYNPGDTIENPSSDITLYAIWSRSYIGGFIGKSYAEGESTIAVVSSYWDIETSGQITSDGGEGKTTAEMMIQSTFVDWDFDTIWRIVNNEMYPHFLIADFSTDVISGNAPLTVNFTNTSGFWPEGIAMVTHDWDFGDGSPHSNLLNPAHIYSTNGTYTVTLIETRDYIQDTRIKAGYITVGEAVIEADFVGVPLNGYQTLTVQFTDLSTGIFDNWYWEFGDRTYSNEQNPIHYYAHPGLYTVKLTVSGISGTTSKIKFNYVSVTNIATYDVAPEPDKKIFLWGTGLVKKSGVGVEFKMINR